jgi:hypothetical protein
LFLLSNMPGTALDEILVGAAVEARFEDVEGGHVLPQFRLAGSGK